MQGKSNSAVFFSSVGEVQARGQSGLCRTSSSYLDISEGYKQFRGLPWGWYCVSLLPSPAPACILLPALEAGTEAAIAREVE